jgi:hypothetical protein
MWAIDLDTYPSIESVIADLRKYSAERKKVLLLSEGKAICILEPVIPAVNYAHEKKTDN